jgi:hypothetical protein
MRLDHQSGAPGRQPVPRLLKSAHRLAGAPCQTEQLPDPSSETILHDPLEILGYSYVSAGCSCEATLLASGF